MSWLEEYPLSFAAIISQWDRQMSFIDPNAIFYVYACNVTESVLNVCVEMYNILLVGRYAALSISL